MNRRLFLASSLVGPFAHLLPVTALTDAKAFGQQRQVPREWKADLAIIGGGVGGVACALAAARNGLQVILTEETDWIGGQFTAQAVPPDEHPWIEERGSTRTYRTFRNRVRDYYRRHYPLTEAAANDPKLNPGLGTVSKLCHEPKVALAVLLEMLAPYVSARRVRILQPFVAMAAELDRDTVTAILGRTRSDRVMVLEASYFVDATELGDLLPLAKVEHVTGSESQNDTREPHASPEARPHNHQAFTLCFAMDYQPDRDNTIETPRNYKRWREYIPQLNPPWPGPLLSWVMSDPRTLKKRELAFDPTQRAGKGLNLWTYRRILAQSHFADDAGFQDICLVNWPQNDYWLGNLFGGGPDDREHYLAARDLSLSLLYWMQTEAPHPDGKKQGWKGLRLRGDVTGTDESDGLAMAPYIRESRRIRAVFTVTENHIGTEARAKATGKKVGEVTAEPFQDTVGTGSYRIDLHPTSGGDNYVDISSLPFQIPLGALIPIRVENLLPACKNIGTTHITNGCYRLHPVEWSIGEAVGELVAYCLAKKRVPRQVRKDQKLLSDFQARLAQAGCDLHWPEEIAKIPR
ncbi:MAG: FAD-dependent oxidoreductase [Gemmataceae bacterium]|nr:FAD-dependent oxidoreductase [Gemmata sp.]MDW8196148.1 FAD-dependent oxidoreductase [Gemmataceae bacterium]